MLYLHLALEQFSCNEEKILWTLAFFKDGQAARWSENLFHQEVNTGIFSIQSWAHFEQQFRSQFFPVNVEADAINALEGSSYYQGNWMVDDYLDTFLTLVSDTGYTDLRTLVVKFYRGLKSSIQSQMLLLSLDDSRITRGECLGRTRWSSSLDLTIYLYYFYK